jgi:hypothetical protein
LAAWWQTASTSATTAVRAAGSWSEATRMSTARLTSSAPRPRAGHQGVEHDDVGAGVDEGVDDVAADEAGSSGDEDPHE